ncbi:TetR family transcriptional regulator [Xylanimonas allomyrinae]|uniref:TetR family transcriptional regulator n=1 Tax=Xylanimonas allomyrinae TaxID=2509459 RepID=A0A4V0YE99_9MICO|nr:TetR family transcriptional regulator [Xylanimonas allomyrinae]QAY63471.1 TetR family transcriptional regulator [Xylanimonas allomyrinae]
MTAISNRTALLRATIAVVARSGLRALTYRAVAAEAGVSHGLVRHHFGSRDALIAAALAYAVERSLAESTPQPRTAEEFALGLEDLADREREAFQYELALESTRRPELREAVRRYYETYRDSIADRLRALGIEDDDLIDVVWLALDGLVFKQVVMGDVPEAAPVLDRIRRIVVAAGRAPAA